MARREAPLVSNVSDTARWVAVYRAWESARRNALFRDPFADRFAGKRGRAMARFLPRSGRSGWPIITRTKLIDDQVLASVSEGCDRVLNLAAGFDTRPYRLELPSRLQWIEADLPGIVEEKERVLADSVPACQLRRESVDLANGSERAAFLARATSGAAAVLVITEGLLAYLPDDQVRALARDLHGLGPLRYWVLDLFSPAVLRRMTLDTGRLLERAPLHFAPPEGISFFESLGWSVCEVQNIIKAAVRFRRLPWFLWPVAFFPSADPRKPGEQAFWSAVVRLARTVAIPVTSERRRPSNPA